MDVIMYDHAPRFSFLLFDVARSVSAATKSQSTVKASPYITLCVNTNHNSHRVTCGPYFDGLRCIPCVGYLFYVPLLDSFDTNSCQVDLAAWSVVKLEFPTYVAHQYEFLQRLTNGPLSTGNEKKQNKNKQEAGTTVRSVSAEVELCETQGSWSELIRKVGLDFVPPPTRQRISTLLSAGATICLQS